jgi:DNA-binding CsgD family transcriptional regulator
MKARNESETKLAPKEQEVIRYAAQGLTDKQISVKLQVTLSTVKTYWERVRKKMGASNRVQVVAKVLSDNCRQRVEELQDKIAELSREQGKNLSQNVSIKASTVGSTHPFQ